MLRRFPCYILNAEILKNCSSAMARLIQAAVLLTLLVGFGQLAASAEIPTSEPAVKLPIIDAQDIAFRHLTIKDGLSHSIVNCIVQDDQGFMWFGAQAGLNRYDGYRFKVYKHDHTNPNSLSGAYIRALFKDRSGVIWIGVDQFLDKFDPGNRNIYPLSNRVHRRPHLSGPHWCFMDLDKQRLGSFRAFDRPRYYLSTRSARSFEPEQYGCLVFRGGQHGNVMGCYDPRLGCI